MVSPLANISVIIRTLGRKSLDRSILSATREFGSNVFVLVDGHEAWLKIDKLREKDPHFEIIGFPKTPGCYGSMLLNAGAALAATSHITILDDDDEFVEGAGVYMEQYVADHPEADVIIPGLKFNNGMILCDSSIKGVTIGNVACPTYKREVISKLPFSSYVPEGHEDFHDAYHILSCRNSGMNIAWYEKVLINVRPKMEGTNGRGNE